MSLPPGTYANFNTSEGKIVVRLFESEAPITVKNFIELAEGGKEDLTHGMRYIDHYRKTGETWRFQRRTIVVDWLTAGPTQWAPERPDTRDAEFGRPGPVKES